MVPFLSYVSRLMEYSGYVDAVKERDLDNLRLTFPTIIIYLIVH